MADEQQATTAERSQSVASDRAAGKKLTFLDTLALLFKPAPRTGAHCEYCDWRGAKTDVLSAPRMNEDGKVYQITVCPDCMRNGGLEFFE